MVNSRARGTRPNDWVRAFAPHIATRVLNAVGAVIVWVLALVLMATTALDLNLPYLVFAAGLAAVHVQSGLYFRAAAKQGVWVRADGSMKLCWKFGELVLARGTIERIRFDRGVGSIYVWSGARIWWLETTNRRSFAPPGDERVDAAIATLSETVAPDVGVLERLKDTFAEGRVTALEFSFRGFGRVVRSPAVWISVLVGQILLAPLAG